MAAGFVLGLNAKAYRNTGSYASPTWVEMTNIKDLSLELSTGEADVSTRGSSWELMASTLFKANVTFNMIWDPADATFAAVLAAFLARSVFEVLVLDGSRTTAGNQGLRAECNVFSATRNEPLTGALEAAVTLKPTRTTNGAPTWFTAS